VVGRRRPCSTFTDGSRHVGGACPIPAGPARGAASCSTRRRPSSRVGPVPARPAAPAERDRLLPHRHDRAGREHAGVPRRARELRRLRQGQRRVRAGITSTPASASRPPRRRSPDPGVQRPGGSTASTLLENDYWLPAATLTWEVTPDLQVRLSGSKTIARPQFRELIYQPYFDPRATAQYLGNPLLVDSELWNGEARLEYYFAPEQKLSGALFYKKIDNPIESFVTQFSGFFTTSYANAPEAQLFGVELEGPSTSTSRFLPQSRRLVVVGNYTYTKSEAEGRRGDPVAVFASSSTDATDFFRDGSPLTGQSDHLVNLQVGLESAGPAVAADLPADLRQRARRQPRPQRHSAAARHHRGARLPARLRDARGLRRSSSQAFEARSRSATSSAAHDEFQEAATTRIDDQHLRRRHDVRGSISVTF
jgi:hypothetical protein